MSVEDFNVSERVLIGLGEYDGVSNLGLIGFHGDYLGAVFEKEWSIVAGVPGSRTVPCRKPGSLHSHSAIHCAMVA